MTVRATSALVGSRSNAGEKRIRFETNDNESLPRKRKRRRIRYSTSTSSLLPALTTLAAYDPEPIALLHYEHRGCNLLKSLIATWLILNDSGACDDDASLRRAYPAAVESSLRGTVDNDSSGNERRLRLLHASTVRRCALVGRYRQFRSNRTAGVSIAERAVTALNNSLAVERDMLKRDLTWEAQRLHDFVVARPDDDRVYAIIDRPLLVVRSSFGRLRFDEMLRRDEGMGAGNATENGTGNESAFAGRRYLLLARDSGSSYVAIERAAWKVLQSAWLPYLTLKLPVYPLLVKHWVLLTGDPAADRQRRRNVIDGILRLLVPQSYRMRQRVLSPADERFAIYESLFRIADCWNDPEAGGLYALRDAVRRSVGEERSPRSFLSAIAAFLLMGKPHLLRVGGLLALHRLFERGIGRSGRPSEIGRLTALREDFRALRLRVAEMRERCGDLSDDDAYVPLTEFGGTTPSIELTMELYRLCASNDMRPEDARRLFLSLASVGEKTYRRRLRVAPIATAATFPVDDADAYVPIAGLVGVRSRTSLGTGVAAMWRRGSAADDWLRADERFRAPEDACATLFSTTVGLLAALELGALSEKLLQTDVAFEGVLNYGVRLADFEGRSGAVHSHGTSKTATEPVVYEDELFVAFPSEFENDENDREPTLREDRVPDVVLETLFCHVPQMLVDIASGAQKRTPEKRRRQ